MTVKAAEALCDGDTASLTVSVPGPVAAPEGIVTVKPLPSVPVVLEVCGVGVIVVVVPCESVKVKVSVDVWAKPAPVTVVVEPAAPLAGLRAMEVAVTGPEVVRCSEDTERLAAKAVVPKARQHATARTPTLPWRAGRSRRPRRLRVDAAEWAEDVMVR